VPIVHYSRRGRDTRLTRANHDFTPLFPLLTVSGELASGFLLARSDLLATILVARKSALIDAVLTDTCPKLLHDGQTGSYEHDAAHVMHLIQSDSKERKVKSSRLRHYLQVVSGYSHRLCPEPRSIRPWLCKFWAFW